MRVAVFCASSNRIDRVYVEDARRLGSRMGELGWHLVYGGVNAGLMKEVADACGAVQGAVTGIVPRCIYGREGIVLRPDRLIVAEDMKERKHLLRENADAFVALPGGWGTLEEITEVITLKQLGIHRKPVVFLNTAGFYDGFLEFIAGIRKQGFISPAYDSLYQVAGNVDETICHLLNPPAGKVEAKY